MHEKFIAAAAVVLNAIVPALASTVVAPQPHHSAQPREDSAPQAPYALRVSQNTSVPLRWPEFRREPEPRPIPQQGPRNYPGSSLGGSAYGRSPGGGTTTSHRIWPRSGRVYPAPYNNPSPPEPLRWPEYPR